MEDEHTNGKKLARNGRNTVIYKGTFVSNHSLVVRPTDDEIPILTDGNSQKGDSMNSVPSQNLFLFYSVPLE